MNATELVEYQNLFTTDNRPTCITKAQAYIDCKPDVSKLDATDKAEYELKYKVDNRPACKAGKVDKSCKPDLEKLDVAAKKEYEDEYKTDTRVACDYNARVPVLDGILETNK